MDDELDRINKMFDTLECFTEKKSQMEKEQEEADNKII